MGESSFHGFVPSSKGYEDVRASMRRLIVEDLPSECSMHARVTASLESHIVSHVILTVTSPCIELG